MLCWPILTTTTDKEKRVCCLSVGLGDALKLVLLLDGVAVGGALGGVDQLVTKTLSDALNVSEGGLAGPSAQKPDSLRIKIMTQCEHIDVGILV